MYHVISSSGVAVSCTQHEGVLGPEVNVRILSTCEYVTLYGKRDFSDVIKLRVLKQGDYAGLYRWAQCHHEGPYKREAGESEKVM